MIGLLKMEFGWGTLKAADIVGYVPMVISKDDYKDITGKDYDTSGKVDGGEADDKNSQN
ncbi:XkdX family protein [Companilactobacillus keshanensis]|uniref:XkdX family protein n=1 Tax=Companilactobacillus keshanensis TaxID=2486003 RepID=A0ABW4BU84_9LACO|nr:XkdX family protein [Companilactobacillus keshanensis]